MSLAATIEAIQRGLAAALDDKDRPYKPGERYEVDDARAELLARASALIIEALKLNEVAQRQAHRAEKPKPPAAKPKPAAPKLAHLPRLSRTKQRAKPNVSVKEVLEAESNGESEGEGEEDASA